MNSLKQSLKNLDSQNKQGAQIGKHLRNQSQHFCLQRNLLDEGEFACLSVSEAKLIHIAVVVIKGAFHSTKIPV